VKNATKGPLAESIDRYIAHKRSLGKQLAKTEPMLHLLDGYLLAHGIAEIDQITPSHLEDFVTSRPRHTPCSYNLLLGMIRRLFDWMVVHEVLHESPFRCKKRRATATRRPFLFNPEQARNLLDAALELPDNSRAQNRGDAYRLIFAILYGLGLRVGEVSRLRRHDVDLDKQLMVIRQTKFGKDRLVPFGPKMASAIAGFLQREESRFGPSPVDSPVFSFNKRKRTPIGTNTISSTFRKMLPALHLAVQPGIASPHLHCLRHSFAVGTLLRWYREGVDPMTRLLDLSTFLGHVSPSSTAVYLTITTELMESASQRFAQFAEGSRKECVR
jgi:site-specific recombinase XerD